MNIAIDQGNTSAKIAFFEGKQLVESFRFKSLTKEDILSLLKRFSPDKGIISSVGTIDKELVTFLKEELPVFIELDEHTPFPISIAYKTPHTLGKDRVAAVIGAYSMQKGKNLLVIDVGTAITYDFIDANGIYHGGNISPGMTSRFKALHQFTKQLPLIDENGDIPEFGYNTETAIRTGVVDGIVREIDSYILEYKKKYKVLTFLTGGHSFFFDNKLKNSIFADGNLVLKGLNEILIHQYA